MNRNQLPVVQRTWRLYHASTQQLGVGHVLGPYERTLFAEGWDDKQRRVENVLEAARPSEAPRRDQCVYVTTSLDLVHAWIRTKSGTHVYQVQIPNDATAFGCCDMRYLDFMANRGGSPEHASDYWNRLPSPSGLVSYEVLAERVVIVRQASPDLVERARGNKLMQLTHDWLFPTNDSET